MAILLSTRPAIPRRQALQSTLATEATFLVAAERSRQTNSKFCRPWSAHRPSRASSRFDSSVTIKLLVSNAIKLRPRADEQTTVSDGDAGTQVMVALVAHRGLVKQFELLARLHHEHVAAMVQEINFAVGGRGGGLDFRLAAWLARPFDLAAGRHDTGECPSIAVQNVEPAVVKQRCAHVGGNFALRASPGQS